MEIPAIKTRCGMTHPGIYVRGKRIGFCGLDGQFFFEKEYYVVEGTSKHHVLRPVEPVVEKEICHECGQEIPEGD